MSRVIRRLGWVRDLPDPRDHLFSAPLQILQTLPDKVVLQPEFEIYDQGRIGSCTANALAGAVQFDRMKAGENPSFVPSRLFIYYNERSIEGDIAMDGGAQLRDGIKSLKQKGVCPEKDWPYDDTPPETEGGPFPSGSKPAEKPPKTCYAEAKTYVITSYQRLNQTLSQLQGCLASGFPFSFGFSVFSGWYNKRPHEKIIPIPSQADSVVGGHAVLCVGYDNETRLFKIRNSWGPGEGEQGYFYMPYSYVTDASYCGDFWVINTVKS